MPIDNAVLDFDKISATAASLADAYKIISKRTVFDRKTLKPVRIPMLADTPPECVDKIKGKTTTIVDYELYKRTGKIVRSLWNASQELPADNWKFTRDLPEKDYEKVMHCFVHKDSAHAVKKGSVRWVHDILTKKNKMIGKHAKLPEGYAEGMHMSEEAVSKMRAGGKLSAAKEKFANGCRWIHHPVTKKNKLVDKTVALPEGFCEGMYDKRFELYQKQIDELSS